MPGATSAFEEWVHEFHNWQKDIGFDTRLLGDYKFETKFGELDDDKIEFGDYAGEPKWETVRGIPHQQVRDALEHLIVYQGDTEFASVEQQRHLVKTAPSDYDLKSAVRVMSEEMRHGWQMCYLLTTHFGESGTIEASKLLKRRADSQQRLLGSFNEPVRHWLDFFVFTQFVDRDGKYQLKMLSRCAFAPLARSMGPMLKEEAFHLGTGHTGLKRIVEAGKVPTSILQKYVNRWVPTAYDLFGKDESGSAEWAYVYGLKCRFNEKETHDALNKKEINDYNRNLYHQEISKLIDEINVKVRSGEPKLYAPDLKFHRAIGRYAGKPYDVHGKPIPQSSYEEYVASVLPNDDDERKLAEIFRTNDWIAPREVPTSW
ncbi:MAG: Phenylacetic acid catabolic protein [Methanobacteriota archaeon]